MNGQLAMRFGQDRALERAGAEWVEKALRGVHVLRQATFTAEDLRELIGDPPTPNALGAVFKLAERQGLIRPYGFERSTRPEARGRVLTRWVAA